MHAREDALSVSRHPLWVPRHAYAEYFRDKETFLGTRRVAAENAFSPVCVR